MWGFEKTWYQSSHVWFSCEILSLERATSRVSGAPHAHGSAPPRDSMRATRLYSDGVLVGPVHVPWMHGWAFTNCPQPYSSPHWQPYSIVWNMYGYRTANTASPVTCMAVWVWPASLLSMGPACMVRTLVPHIFSAQFWLNFDGRLNTYTTPLSPPPNPFS